MSSAGAGACDNEVAAVQSAATVAMNLSSFVAKEQEPQIPNPTA